MLMKLRTFTTQEEPKHFGIEAIPIKYSYLIYSVWKLDRVWLFSTVLYEQSQVRAEFKAPTQ